MTLFGLLAGCAVESISDEEISTGYAEAIYADYAAASRPGLPGEQHGVQLDVQTAASGALSELAGRSFESIVGLPTYQVEAREGALELSDVHFRALNPSRVDRTELAATVDGFDGVGLPLAEGRYRKLDVTVSIGGAVQRHRAVELCWNALGHCVVFDPNIEFLDSIVNGQRQRRAEGWAPRLQTEPRQKSSPDGNALAVCGLSSNPSITSRSWTWSPYSLVYKNVYGITMVTKNLGGQQSGIRCDSSCNPAPFGYSNSSSAFANIPYSVDCGNKFVSGITDRSGKFEAETKCSHNLIFTAKADATASGVGVSIDIVWDTTGSIDSNGGQTIDTCGFF